MATFLLRRCGKALECNLETTARSHPLPPLIAAWWDGKVALYSMCGWMSYWPRSACVGACFPSSRWVAWLWRVGLGRQSIYSLNYSAVFSSFVTTCGTRGRRNIKPQDPGEPKEPFGLVPPPPSPPPPVFLCVSFALTTPILLSPFSLLFFHPSCPSSLFLHPPLLLSRCYSSPPLLFKPHYLVF